MLNQNWKVMLTEVEINPEETGVAKIQMWTLFHLASLQVVMKVATIQLEGKAANTVMTEAFIAIPLMKNFWRCWSSWSQYQTAVNLLELTLCRMIGSH